MSLYDLCEINEISIQQGIPFSKAIQSYRRIEEAAGNLVLVPARSPFIGSLEVVL